MILTDEEALHIAHDAGFRDNQLITIVSIGHAESGLDTNAVGHNAPDRNCPDGSLDRGWLQFNSCYHADVPAACAFDPNCAAQNAYQLVQRVGGFMQWSSYVAGTYKSFIARVTAVAARIGLIGTVQQTGVETMSIEVPSTWVTEVSQKLGIADPMAGTAAPTAPAARTYTVESGDTLSGIASKLAGNENLWPQIYTLNTHVIGDNPDLIMPGMILTIPDNWPHQ